MKFKNKKTNVFTALLTMCLASLLFSCSKKDSTSSDTTTTTTTDTSSSSTTYGVSALVTAANTFYASLTTTQKASVQLSYTVANAIKWSNLPCGSTCRVGLPFTSMTDAQILLAKKVLAAAYGTGTGTGYNQVSNILAADSVLNVASSSSTYGKNIYFIAFLGTPSTTGTWELYFSGHHLSAPITINNGAIVSASPFFLGVEPKTWTSGTTTIGPLANNVTAMSAILSSLSSSQISSMTTSTTYSDVLLGPNSDGAFPTTKVGLKCSTLSTAQKALVDTAMAQWVRLANDSLSASILSDYIGQIDNTYISFSGKSTGALAQNTDYIRIDGPRVWIEFVCQTGVVYTGQIHYHTVYRDHSYDYGGNFSF